MLSVLACHPWTLDFGIPAEMTGLQHLCITTSAPRGNAASTAPAVQITVGVPTEDRHYPVATGNSAGGGDRSGLYQGVLRQNLGTAGPVSTDGGRLPRTRRRNAKLAGAVPTMPKARSYTFAIPHAPA